jgi:hypothetical protein
MEIKKKELIGNFAREGTTHIRVPVEMLDHDSPRAGKGKLIPHGLYDLARNEGYLHLNTRHDTATNFIATVLPTGRTTRVAGTILRPVACCCAVVAAAMPPIGMSSKKHYKPWPIDSDWKSGWRIIHRIVSSIIPSNIACFHTLPALARVSSFTRFQSPSNSCKTRTGIKVTVDILTGVYATGKKCAADFLETMPIVFDDHLPRWNYRAIPLQT